MNYFKKHEDIEIENIKKYSLLLLNERVLNKSYDSETSENTVEKSEHFYNTKLLLVDYFSK